LTLILTVLFLVCITAVLLSRTTILLGASSATNVIGEDASFTSTSSISELPRTGGP
jgi:hypothetical protein